MDRIWSLIAIFLLSFIVVDGKGNTLNSSEVLRNDDLLSSSNGRFQLGFFNNTNTTNQYLGIWFTDPQKTVVWVANREHPIISGAAVLYLSPDGTLFLQDSTGQVLWSTGSQISKGAPEACLLDTGLLVINDTNTGNLLWQSLHHLTDTLLPYVPLGYSKMLDSILEIQLSSWNITGIDPSPGEVVRKLDPSRRYELVTYRGSNVTYRTGPWDGQRWNGFPKMTQNLVKFFVTKSGENRAYFWYEPLNKSDLWRQVLNSNGIMYRYYFNGNDWIEYWKAPDESIPSYNACGPYGIYYDGNCKCCDEHLFQPKNERDWKNRIFSGGCERNVPLDGTHNGFVTLTHVKFPDTINAISYERKSESECKSWCQYNSSCMAYAHIEWQGCLAWFGDLIDMQQFLSGGNSLYIRVASDGGTDPTNWKTILLATLLSIGGFLILLAVTVSCYCARNRIQRWLFGRARAAGEVVDAAAVNVEVRAVHVVEPAVHVGEPAG